MPLSVGLGAGSALGPLSTRSPRDSMVSDCFIRLFHHAQQLGVYTDCILDYIKYCNKVSYYKIEYVHT